MKGKGQQFFLRFFINSMVKSLMSCPSVMVPPENINENFQ